MTARPAHHVMTSEYAGALGVQLDELSRVLDAFDQDADDHVDGQVSALISRVAEARELARQIETQRRGTLPPLPQRKRRGVTLGKI